MEEDCHWPKAQAGGEEAASYDESKRAEEDPEGEQDVAAAVAAEAPGVEAGIA